MTGLILSAVFVVYVYAGTPVTGTACRNNKDNKCASCNDGITSVLRLRVITLNILYWAAEVLKPSLTPCIERVLYLHTHTNAYIQTLQEKPVVKKYPVT